MTILFSAAIINVTCFLGFGVVVGLTEVFGRRKTLTIISLPVLICWLMVYFAQDKSMLLASRAVVGSAFGGVLVMTYINVGEYVSPNMRSFCLNIMLGIGTSLGTMLGHILCLFMHWKTVALIGLIPSALSAFMPLFWVESPSWLATHKRFDECEEAFKALHISTEASERELRMLIECQKNQKIIPKGSNPYIQLMKKFIEMCKTRYYWKTALLTIIICFYRVAAGRILLTTLAITIIHDITGAADIIEYTVMVDGFALIGSGISCVLVSKFKMRPLLICSGIISNSIQIIFALSLYLWQDQHMAWVKISLLALYYITVTAGPYSVIETLLTELQPLEIKTINCLFIGTIVSVVQYLHIQFATKMFAGIGYHGVFFLDSAIVFICLIYIYFQLPETKGRTLQEIEYYFKHNRFQNELNYIDCESESVLIKASIEKSEKINCNEKIS